MNGTLPSKLPRRRALAVAIAVAMWIWAPLASAEMVSSAQSIERLGLVANELAAPFGAEALLTSACPQRRERWSHLEAGRSINDKLALAAAIRHAAALRDGSAALPLRERILQYQQPSNAREFVATLHREYGPNSLLSRGADAIASIAIVAEDTTQLPLDRLNSITGTIFQVGTRALGLAAAPQLKLRSGITADKAGVTLSTRW